MEFNHIHRECGRLGRGKTFGPFDEGLNVQFISGDDYNVMRGFNIAYRQEKIRKFPQRNVL